MTELSKELYGSGERVTGAEPVLPGELIGAVEPTQPVVVQPSVPAPENEPAMPTPQVDIIEEPGSQPESDGTSTQGQATETELIPREARTRGDAELAVDKPAPPSTQEPPAEKIGVGTLPPFPPSSPPEPPTYPEPKDQEHRLTPTRSGDSQEPPSLAHTIASPVRPTGAIAPQKRGGRPRVEEQSIIASPAESTAFRHAKPELVCWQRGTAWQVGLEMPEEIVDAPNLEVIQGEKPLAPDDLNENRFPLRSLTEPVLVRWSEMQKQRQFTLEQDGLGWFLFKLHGQKLNQGRRVGNPSFGSYLVIASRAWRRDEDRAGPPPVVPQPVFDAGYQAHFFDLERNSAFSIALESVNGEHIDRARVEPMFDLTGFQIADADEFHGPLFGLTPPRIQCAGSQRWDQVKTIVLGQEGAGHNRWRTFFHPDASEPDQALPEEFAERGAGWYFLRFYDHNDDLNESLDFRFVPGLRDMKYIGASLLPGIQGYGSIEIEFHHESELDIEPAPRGTQLLEKSRQPGVTRFTIPPQPEYDVVEWSIEENGARVPVVTRIERIWWAIMEVDAAPEWGDQTVSLSKPDFAAVSRKQLAIRFPSAGWTKAVELGLDDTPRKYELRLDDMVLRVRLMEFRESTVLRRLGQHALTIGLLQKGRPRAQAIGILTIAGRCRKCDFRTTSEPELLVHIQREHLGEYFRPMTYDELRDRDPRLPRDIYQCPYCTFYAASDPIDNPTSKIYSHIRSRHGATAERFRVVKDVGEIREFVIRDLLDVDKCRLCADGLEHPTPQVRWKHLQDKHLDYLFRLE